MADKEEILLEIVISNDVATQNIFESQKAIDRLKQSQIELTAEYKKGNITQEEYSKKSTAVKVAISQQSEVIRANEKEIKNNIKTQNANEDSLISLRAQLSNNTKAYDSLSKAERESAKGQELQKSIISITKELKEGEEATDRFQRTVGKYPETMGGAGKGVNQITGFLGKMGDQLGVTGGFAGGFTNTLARASSVIGGFASKSSEASEASLHMANNISHSGEALNAVEGFAGKATGSLDNLSKGASVAGASTNSAFSTITSGAVTMGKAFLAPPIIIISAIILAIIGAVKLLSEGFKKNDEASEKMSEAFAVFTPILDYVGKLFTAVAGAVADLVLGMSKGIATILDFTAGLFGMETGLSAAAEEARNLVKAQDDLEEAERDFTVNSAKRNVERSKLMAEVTDKFKNDAKTRIALLKDALELDRANLVDEKKIAYERLRIILEIAKNENDTSDETAKKIAEARAQAYNAQAKYFDGVKEINKKLSSAEQELADEQKKRFDEWKKNKDEQIAKETVLVRQLEDLTIQQIKDDYQRQIEAEKAKTERANKDLKFRLDNEKNLTSEARKAINEIILLNNKNLIDKEAELIDKSLESNIKKEIDAKTKSIDAQIQLSTKGSEDELTLKIAKLQLLKDAELSSEQLTYIERLAITDKYEKQEADLKSIYLDKKRNDLRESLDKEFKLKLLYIKNSDFAADQQVQLEYERAKSEYDNLKSLDEEAKTKMYASQLDYEIAVQESQKRLNESMLAISETQLKGMQSFRESMATITGSISDLITTMADDSYEAAKYAKALALVNIGVSLAVGIAGAVSAASKASTWYEMIAAIAIGISAVTTGIVQAKKAFEDTPTPKRPAFAKGGLIRGAGTGTSDSVPIDASNGESVMNAQTTSMFTPLLSALNVAGGGVSFGAQAVNSQMQGEEMLAIAFARGAASLPPPIVGIKELNEASDRVVQIKNL